MRETNLSSTVSGAPEILRTRRPVSLTLDPTTGLRVRILVHPGVHEPDPYAGKFAAAMAVEPGCRVLDVGCGAGTYAVAAALRGAGAVVATDVDPRAVQCTLANASLNGVADRVEGRSGPLFEPVLGERFDLVITSLPQLPAPRPVTPTRYGGPDGLDVLRRVAVEAGSHLVPGGRLYLLVTGWAGPDCVGALLEERGFDVREVARAERAFRPIKYDRISPGLFEYLDGRARKGLASCYRRSGSWCYLGVSFLEARLRD